MTGDEVQLRINLIDTFSDSITYVFASFETLDHGVNIRELYDLIEFERVYIPIAIHHLAAYCDTVLNAAGELLAFVVPNVVVGSAECELDDFEEFVFWDDDRVPAAVPVVSCIYPRFEPWDEDIILESVGYAHHLSFEALRYTRISYFC